MRRRRVFGWVLGFLLVSLVALRLALPTIVLHYVNRTLTRIPEYRGHIADIDIALIRGAYVIKDLEVVKTSGKVPAPLVKAPVIDLSVEWRALFEGKFVGEIISERPTLNFVYSPDPKAAQLEVDNEWLQVVKDLFPLRINRFEINDGSIHYRDFGSTPKVDVYLTKVGVLGTNLNNTRSLTSDDWATIQGDATVQNKGRCEVDVKLLPAAKKPTFKGSGKVEKLPATELNELIKAYLAVDAESGEVNIYSEVSAENDRLKGYIKPLIRDLSILSLKDDADGPLQLFWESIVSLLAELLTNQRHDQIATKVDFEGSLEHAEVNRWRTFAGILGNAFVEALKKGIDKPIQVKNP